MFFLIHVHYVEPYLARNLGASIDLEVKPVAVTLSVVIRS